MAPSLCFPPAFPPSAPAGCHDDQANLTAKAHWGETDFRLARGRLRPSRDLLRPGIPVPVGRDGSQYSQAGTGAGHGVELVARPEPWDAASNVPTEPYHPAYFLINGRSMPDLMDANYAAEYPHQPYNGNPHMHPGELTLIRSIGQGRWQHPFHEHANHVRILARDGNLILSQHRLTPKPCRDILMFNTDTTPGQAFDGIFYLPAEA